MKGETACWIGYAGENLRSAELLFESRLYNPCLQNIQQAIEKMLKALLVEKQATVRKTHSIGQLLTLLENGGLSIDISQDESELIDSIYLPSKYPVSAILPDFEPNEVICRQCLAIAKRVKQSVEKALHS